MITLAGHAFPRHKFAISVLLHFFIFLQPRLSIAVDLVVTAMNWPNRAIVVSAGSSSGITYDQNFALVGKDGKVYAYIYPNYIGEDRFWSASLSKDVFGPTTVGTLVRPVFLTPEEARRIRSGSKRAEESQQARPSGQSQEMEVLNVNGQMELLLLDWERVLDQLPNSLDVLSGRNSSLMRNRSGAIDDLCREIQSLMVEKGNLLRENQSTNPLEKNTFGNTEAPAPGKKLLLLTRDIVRLRQELARAIDDFTRFYETTISAIDTFRSDRFLEGYFPRVEELDSRRQAAVDDILRMRIDDPLERIDKQAAQIGRRESSLRGPFKDARTATSTQERKLKDRSDSLVHVLKQIHEFQEDDRDAVFAHVRWWTNSGNIIETTLAFGVRLQDDLINTDDMIDVLAKKDQSLEEFSRALVAAMNKQLVDCWEKKEAVAKLGYQLLDSRRNLEEVWSQVE